MTKHDRTPTIGPVKNTEYRNIMSDQSRVEMAQLRLIKSVFEIQVEQPDDDRVYISVSLKNDGEFLEGGRRAHFVQSFTTGPHSETPFTLDVRFAALFLLDPPPLPLERPYYVRRVFPQIVFPYLREYVAETTRRGGFTPLVLNHNILDLDEDHERFPRMPEGRKTVH